MVGAVGASFASKPPEYGVYGVQRIADKSAEVGDPISAASGAFSWSKVLIPLGGPMELDFSIHYRTDPNAAFARDPGDFPPGYPDFNTFLNAWSWQPGPRLLGNNFFDMTVLPETGAIDQPFTFAGGHGMRRVGSNGLYHARARWYNARMQRFLSKEPQWPVLGNSALLNPYQYALNNPVLYVDADGFSVLLNSLHNFGMWSQEWKTDSELVARRVAMTTALMQQAAYADLMRKFDGWAYVEPQDILELAAYAWVRHAGANPAVQKTYGKARRERGARLHRAFAALPNQDNPALALLVNALDPARSDAQHAEDRQLLFNAMGLSPGHVNGIDNDIAEKREYMDEKAIQTQFDQREGGLAFEKAFEQTFEKEIVGAGLTYIISGEAFKTLFFGDPR